MDEWRDVLLFLESRSRLLDDLAALPALLALPATLLGFLATTNLPTTGPKLSETPSDVRKTISPSSITVMEHVKLFSSGFWPSTGPKAPRASLISRMALISCEP